MQTGAAAHASNPRPSHVTATPSTHGSCQHAPPSPSPNQSQCQSSSQPSAFAGSEHGVPIGSPVVPPSSSTLLASSTLPASVGSPVSGTPVSGDSALASTPWLV